MKNIERNQYGNNSDKNSRKKFENKSFSKSNRHRKFEDSKYLSKTKNSSKSDESRKYSNKFNKNKNNDNKDQSYNSRTFKSRGLNTSKDTFVNNERFEFENKKLDDLIWGKHSVYSALESNRPINKIWCTSDIRSSEKFFILLKEVKTKGVLVEEVPWTRISQITHGAVHQGIALQVSYTKTISLENLIIKSKEKNPQPLLIVLDGITDPHNVGAIIRSAEAFGCLGVIIPQRRSAGITGTVAKVSAGALEHISISRVINLNRSLQTLKNEGFIVVGLTEKGNISLSKFKEKAPMVIVVGSENKGISLITQKYCDYLIKIPLKGKTSSLNASVAAAITINHLTRIF